MAVSAQTLSSSNVRPFPRGALLAVAVIAFLAVAPLLAPLTPIGRPAPPPPPPTAFGRILLEPSAEGAILSLVLLDERGFETAATGELSVQIHRTDGEEMRFVRPAGVADFRPLPEESKLAGRLGYQLRVPDDAWVRAPVSGSRADLLLTMRTGASDRLTWRSTVVFP